MKNRGSPNIENRNTNIKRCFDIQNRALKVSFEIGNLILGNVLYTKEGFDHYNMKNSDNPNIEN